ncbi:TetR/AcrR family transcriptional regulator [Sphingobacterium paludis]|uniref:TetR family transcriptional regulator n=1 Tax=Sphingobacterium paludis TaxID=1476465 RepID=A0A4R7D0D1_9SPHI|nr:hypothetical protein [Sphingobacterium paludis]TDS13757.1 hypothetical protein B0I21_10483 [Sphingobacterium paludis]
MNRKKKPSPKTTRNRQRSINLLLESVGGILASKSYSELNITELTAFSRLNPKLIYLYFGGLDGLIEQYLHNKQQNLSPSQKLSQNIALHPQHAADEDLFSLLETQLDELLHDNELKGILHWGLSSKNLKAMAALQKHEDTLHKALEVSKANKNMANNFDPVAFALLAAGATFLAIQSKNKATSLFNIDLHNDDVRNQLKRVLERLLVNG